MKRREFLQSVFGLGVAADVPFHVHYTVTACIKTPEPSATVNILEIPTAFPRGQIRLTKLIQMKGNER